MNEDSEEDEEVERNTRRSSSSVLAAVFTNGSRGGRRSRNGNDTSVDGAEETTRTMPTTINTTKTGSTVHAPDGSTSNCSTPSSKRVENREVLPVILVDDGDMAEARAGAPYSSEDVIGVQHGRFASTSFFEEEEERNGTGDGESDSSVHTESEENEEDIIVDDDVKVGQQASGFDGLRLHGWTRVLTLTMALLEALSTSYLWLYRTLLMAIFIVILLPGFVRIAFFYFSSTVRRNVVYGLFSRNRLDIIYPSLSIPSPSRGRPIVIFVSGGAWIIGNKAWGTLLGKRLAEQGCLTVLIDYRNFPQAKVDTMVDDVHRGISWVIANAHSFGGDSKRVHLVGQSAGAHLSALALLRECIRVKMSSRGAGGRENDPPVVTPMRTPSTLRSGSLHVRCPAPVVLPRPSASILNVRSFVGISGVYNLTGTTADHFDKRGLSLDIFHSIFKVRSAVASAATSTLSASSSSSSLALLSALSSATTLVLGSTLGANKDEMSPSISPERRRSSKAEVFARLSEWSPSLLLQNLSTDDDSDRDESMKPPLPRIRIRLLHGTADKSVPYLQTINFGEALMELNKTTSGASGGDRIDVAVKLLAGKTHLDPFVIDPLRGGRDTCIDEILELVDADIEDDADERKRRSIVFEPIQSPSWVRFGGTFCPF